MTNTALRAENSNSRTITFKSREHEKFYEEYLKKCRYQDIYHRALVYCLGIDRDTRNNVNKIYNFKTGCVKTECLQEGWQTSGSLRILWKKQKSLDAEQYALKEILIFMEKADLNRQASLASAIMDCRKVRMHLSFCAKN